MARLSRCRPISGFRPAHTEYSVCGGVVRYARNTGETNFRRRAPLQLASTLGFILNRKSGKFLGSALTPDEKAALHECLVWLRQDGNNRLNFYGQELEDFDVACRKLMGRIKQIIPEGCNRARIRATTRASRKMQDGTLADTMGDEMQGRRRRRKTTQPFQAYHNSYMCKIRKEWWWSTLMATLPNTIRWRS